VELEQRIIDAMGQFTEAEFLNPLQSMLREFSDRYTISEKLREVAHIPPQVRVAILSKFHWKKILVHGELFPQFDVWRTALNIEYRKIRNNCKLVWCDPNSLVEVRIKLDDHLLLFLFNGTQFAAVRLIFKQPRTLEGLRAKINVDDLPEQISTLVGAGLLIEDPQFTYTFNLRLDFGVNRNYAKKYTSAANLEMLRLKEEGKKWAIKARIMRLVKPAKNGVPIQHVLNDVKGALEKFWTIDREMIRAQMKELEVLKYMRVEQKEREHGDLLVYVPDTTSQAE
jgi:hypothetical protein